MRLRMLSSTLSPIDTLHEELLWRIFLENTYDEERLSPLTTARRGSQVCQRWRAIYLSSSSIWGRVVDVNCLQQEKNDWRKEVFARTGGALLWVYGHVNRHRHHAFFFPFLEKNWKRVQIFDLSYSESSQLLQENSWAFLKEPAPQLRNFELGISDLPKNVLPCCLFADNAPTLIEFEIRNESYKFPTNASWLPNLVSVTFSQAFALEELLSTLQKMPRLVSLTICIDPEMPHRRGPKVFLPNLRMLETHGGVLQSRTILEHITPSPDCCLSTSALDITLRPPGQNVEEYEKYENALKSYIVPYFSLHPPSVVTFSTAQDIFFLRDPLDPKRIWDKSTRKSEIVLSISYVPSSLLMKRLISSNCLSNVTRLQLTAITHPTPADNHVYESILAALDAFPCVTTMLTNDETLKQLCLCPQLIASNVLPALTTLEVSCCFAWRSRRAPEPPHQTFLKLRKAIGRPISVLDIGIQNPDNWKYLEEHTGLLVKWETMRWFTCTPGEYVCGEGHPERIGSEVM